MGQCVTSTSIRKIFCLFRLWLLAVSLVCVAACSEVPHVPGQIRVALLPDEKPDIVLARHKPLFDYLEKETGLSFRLEVPDSYQEMSARFEADAYDLAYFGGLSFVIAHRNNGAVPLVLRDIDKAFTSVFITRHGSDQIQLKDFVGLAMTFASDQSTSGHLMPRYFLKQQFIEPETFFSRVEFAGTHDKVVRAVLANDVALGAMSSAIYQGMLEDGRLGAQQVRVIWETPAFVNYVWAAHPQLTQEDQDKLTAAFLKLDPSNPAHEQILDGLQAGHFLKAALTDFDQLEEVALSVDLLGK